MTKSGFRTPTVEYRGHIITWSDNMDEWTCYDMFGKGRSSPKLSAIKAQIDRLYLVERKAAAVPCYEVGQPTDGVRYDAQIVEYVKKEVRHSSSGKKEPTVTHRVATVAQRGGSSRASRTERDLANLMPATPEAEVAWAEFLARHTEYKVAETALRAAYAALPRMTEDMIPALIELHNRDNNQEQAA